MTVEKKPAKKGANRRAPSNLQYGFANQKSVIGEQHPLAKATQLLPHIEKASRHLLPDDPNQLGGSKDGNFSVFFFSHCLYFYSVSHPKPRLCSCFYNPRGGGDAELGGVCKCDKLNRGLQ